MSQLLLIDFPWETQAGGTVGTMYFSLGIVVVMGLVLMSACLIEGNRKLFYVTAVVTLAAISIILFIGGWFWLILGLLATALGITAFIVWFVKKWGEMEDKKPTTSS